MSFMDKLKAMFGGAPADDHAGHDHDHSHDHSHDHDHSHEPVAPAVPTDPLGVPTAEEPEDRPG